MATEEREGGHDGRCAGRHADGDGKDIIGEDRAASHKGREFAEILPGHGIRAAAAGIGLGNLHVG